MKSATCIIAAIFTLVSGIATANVAEQQTKGSGSLEVRIEGVSSDKGTVYASVYLSDQGFPGVKDAAFDFSSVPAQDGSVVLTFNSVPAGPIAIAVLHDENGDEKLSFNLIGYPKEAYGFSQNPKSMFGPPDFVEAAITLEDGESKALVIRMKG
jgi:uncharacterized protein (DUF2141 family)